LLFATQSVEQLAFADVVVINKIDLVTDGDKATLEQRIKASRIVLLLSIAPQLWQSVALFV